ncbi:MAG: hypothetical protein IT211_14315 [Armatimonadetes bacterium]|nr:hypothetical protein [Armatimonadota bacterium]
MPILHVLLCCVVALLALNCATIFQGRTAQVPVVGPEEPLLIQHNGRTLPIYRREDKSRYVELPRKHPLLLTLRYRGMWDTLVLEPTPQIGWLIASAPLFIGLGPMADITTGSWKTFGNTRIYYGTSDTAERLQGSRAQALRAVQLHLMDTLRQVDTSLYRVLGFYFYPAVAPNLNQEQGSLFSVRSLGCVGGYSIRPDISVGVGYDFASIPNQSQHQPATRNLSSFDQALRHYTAFARYEHRGFFLGLHAGASRVTADSIVSTVTAQRTEGYGATLPHVGASLGYRWDFGFVEYRVLYGVGSISKPDGTTSTMGDNGLRGGIGFSL